MIRSLTCVCALLAGASGLYLYSEKHRTTLLDQQISRIVADTQQVRERTAMLRAEWALLNQPDRLQQLSGRFLPQLGAMAPTQFVQLAALDAHLPAVGPETPPHPIATPQTAPALVGAQPAAPAGAGPETDPGTAAIARAELPRGVPSSVAMQLAQTASIGSHAAVTAAAARLALAHTKTSATHRDVQLADADAVEAGDAASLRRVSARPSARAAHPAAPVRLASAMPTRPAVTTVASAYAHPPVIAAAAWHPARTGWATARPVSYTTPVSAPISAPSIGSALGSARSTLPAPVPVSDGN